jgi:PEP-CTERM motif
MIRTLTVFTAMFFSSGVFASPIVWDTTGNNLFGTIDLSTGNFTELSNFGFTASGLGEIGDALYTVDFNGTTLYSVNQATGGLRVIGNLSPSSNVVYYAFGSTTTGLYMVDIQGGLWNINPTTGVGTLIGSTGLNMQNSQYASVSTGSNILYMSLGSSVYTINTTTGLASFLGNRGTTDFGALINIGNTVYGASVVAPNSIYTFDPATGMAAFLTNSSAPDYSFGLAAIVPEPSSFALLGLGITGCLLAGYAMKRKSA